MKKNGFTLVELLATIMILCITITIVIVQVDKNIKDANDFGNQMQIEAIESATLLYVEEYGDSLSELKQKKVDTVSLETLINAGLLQEKDIKDLDKSNSIVIAEINDNIKVKYTGVIKNVIFLNGPSEISIYVGDEYNEMGAYIVVPRSGIQELSLSNIFSTIDTNNVGKYKVVYSYENTEIVERIVTVIN